MPVVLGDHVLCEQLNPNQLGSEEHPCALIQCTALSCATADVQQLTIAGQSLSGVQGPPGPQGPQGATGPAGSIQDLSRQANGTLTYSGGDFHVVQGGSVLATGGLEVGAGGFTVDANGKVVTGDFEAGYNTALLAPNLYVDDANNTTMVNGTLVVTTNAAANDVFEVHTTAGGGTSFRVDINGNVEAVGNIIATGVGKRVEAYRRYGQSSSKGGKEQPAAYKDRKTGGKHQHTSRTRAVSSLRQIIQSLNL